MKKITEDETCVLIASDDGIFEKLLIQPLYREINKERKTLVSIRVIELKDEYKGQHLFSNFLEKLEKLPINIFFHDIINEKLEKFLVKKDYEYFFEKKYEQELTCLLKLKKT